MNIRDLARHLNVSIGTVSRALNARTGVSDETRRRVVEAARSLDYVPNQSGRSLRQGTTGLIAAMIPTSDDKPLADTIFMAVLEGLRKYLESLGLDLMVLISGPGEEAYANLERTVGRGLVDGILISETLRRDKRIDYLLEKRIPFVAFGRSATSGHYPWIDLDVESIAEQAVARLAGMGHRRIAVAARDGGINYPHLLVAAYEKALRRRGMGIDPNLILPTPGTEQGGYRLGQTIMDMADRPTAVILTEDSMTVGLYRRLTESGLSPGHDLAIVGFQETPSARFLSPKLTCFRGAYKDLGARLGEALLGTIPAYAAPEPNPLIQTLWPMEMVIGESDIHGPRRHRRKKVPRSPEQPSP